MFTLNEYLNHAQDMAGDFNCWGDHAALLAAIFTLGLGLDFLRELIAKRLWRDVGLLGLVQLTSVIFLSLWWFRVFVSLYLTEA